MQSNKFRQPVRTVLFIVYVFLIFLTNKIVLFQWLPAASGKGLWFYTGIASLLMGNFLVTPYYIKPVDAISYSVVSMIALYAVNDYPNWITAERLIFIVTLFYYCLVNLISFAQILTKDSKSATLQKWSNTFRILSEKFGHPNLIFSSLILFALIVFHRDSNREFLGIVITWLLVVILKPDIFLHDIWCKIREIWSDIKNLPVFGILEAVQSPNILLIKPNKNIVRTDFVFLVKNPNSYATFAIGLDCIGFGESRYLRAFELNIPEKFRISALKSAKSLPDNRVAVFSKFEDIQNDIPFLSEIQNLIGVVARDTSIESLFFEVLKEEDLEAGCLVQVEVKSTLVLYQVLNGLTKEDIIYQKTTHGFARAQAQQVGIWDEKEQKFKPAKWIPQINSLVFLHLSEKNELEVENIGHFPFSKYAVDVKDINQLVTHNTAILGILGVGKSMLSIELVERMINYRIKVICLDLTDQYSIELKDFYDIDYETKLIDNLQQIGKQGKTNICKNVEEGGSVQQFSTAIRNEIKKFLDSDNPRMLKIYNPSSLEVWKQDSKPYKDDASMATLTPTEITQILSDSILSVCQDMGMINEARVCIVYEEAHSLIPEWNSVAVEGDKAATSGTSRAILQGRKFGLGCLLITQRTANVTKTILNQCNTIFAMRTFDDTGKAFLSNYLGSTYAELLPNLREREAIFFGRASSCENPVLLRLNDQEDFRKVYRAKYTPPPLPVIKDENSEESDESPENEDIDLPF